MNNLRIADEFGFVTLGHHWRTIHPPRVAPSLPPDPEKAARIEDANATVKAMAASIVAAAERRRAEAERIARDAEARRDAAEARLAELQAMGARRLDLIAATKAVVCDRYALTMVELHSDGRPRAIARPRQVAMAVIVKLTGISLPHCGRLFGNRDHTTIMHAIKAVARRRPDDPHGPVAAAEVAEAVERKVAEGGR